LDRFYGALAKVIETFGFGKVLMVHFRKYPGIYLFIREIIFLVLLVLAIRIFVIEPYKIPSGSMIPALEVGDRIFVFRLSYWLGKVPDRGAVIVFKVPKTIPKYDPDKPIYIKRVVGLPGERVEIRDRHLCVNGEMVTEPKIFENLQYVPLVPGEKLFTGISVPEGEILLFGDNTTSSYDGRAWGTVPVVNVKGRAVFRYWPVLPWRMGLVR